MLAEAIGDEGGGRSEGEGGRPTPELRVTAGIAANLHDAAHATPRRASSAQLW